MSDLRDIYEKLNKADVERAILHEKLEALDTYMHDRNHDILNEIQKLHGVLVKHMVDEDKILQSQSTRIRKLEDAKLAAKSAWFGAKTGIALTFAAIGAAAVYLITKFTGVKL